MVSGRGAKSRGSGRGFTPTIPIAVVILSGLFLLACGERPEERRPQQAGQPLDPVETAARLAVMRVAAVTGNQDELVRQAHEITQDMRRSIRLADPALAVDRESARRVAKQVAGVRSVVWIDAHNLFAIVEENDQRTYAKIDEVCLELESLGDTLGVVVNLQSGAARTGDELEILSRDCQLAPGERALLQRRRQIDVLDPAIRREHKANQVYESNQSSR